MKYTTRVTINLRGTSLVIANILLNTETSTKIGTAFSPIASGVIRSFSSRNRARRKLIDTPSTVPTSKPISAFRPETFVASQINVVFCWNSAQIADGAGRKYGWKSKTLTASLPQDQEPHAEHDRRPDGLEDRARRSASWLRRPPSSGPPIGMPRSASRTSVTFRKNAGSSRVSTFRSAPRSTSITTLVLPGRGDITTTRVER